MKWRSAVGEMSPCEATGGRVGFPLPLGAWRVLLRAAGGEIRQSAFSVLGDMAGGAKCGLWISEQYPSQQHGQCVLNTMKEHGLRNGGSSASP